MPLLAEPIEAAPQSLQDRISYLEGIIVQLKEENAAMAAMQAHLVENQEIQARLIKQLQTKREPQPMQKDRGEILRALLVANGGKMLEKEARQKMHLSKSQFSQILAAMQGDIAAKPYHLDKRQKILQIK